MNMQSHNFKAWSICAGRMKLYMCAMTKLGHPLIQMHMQCIEVPRKRAARMCARFTCSVICMAFTNLCWPEFAYTSLRPFWLKPEQQSLVNRMLICNKIIHARHRSSNDYKELSKSEDVLVDVRGTTNCVGCSPNFKWRAMSDTLDRGLKSTEHT